MKIENLGKVVKLTNDLKELNKLVDAPKLYISDSCDEIDVSIMDSGTSYGKILIDGINATLDEAIGRVKIELADLGVST
jgi:hypothetical protein